MKKIIRLMLIIIIATSLLGETNLFAFNHASTIVQAAGKKYHALSVGEVVKVGDYYYKGVSSGKIKRSTAKNKNFKTIISNANSGVTDGKKIYYMVYAKDYSSSTVYKCDMNGCNKKKLKKISSDYNGIVALYKNKIYISSGSESDEYITYTLQTNGEGGIKLEKKGLDIVASYNEYMIGYSWRSTDVSPSGLCLYNAKTKKKTSLGLGCEISLYGTKVYYASYNSKKDTFSVKRCNYDGSSIKTLATLGGDANLHIEFVGETYCTYMKYASGKFRTYKYVYATKSVTEQK